MQTPLAYHPSQPTAGHSHGPSAQSHPGVVGLAGSGVPVPLRNPDCCRAEVFDHAGFIGSMCRWWRPNVFVEYGVRDCATTSRVAPFCKRVIGVDIERHENMQRIPNLEMHVMRTDEFKPILDKMGIEIDVAFIDACHNSHAILRDFAALWPHVIENGLVFLHDTHPISPKYVQPQFCDDGWRTPFLVRHFFGTECELMTIPIQPGLTMVRKLPRRPMPWMEPSRIDFAAYAADIKPAPASPDPLTTIAPAPSSVAVRDPLTAMAPAPLSVVVDPLKS
jgi:hypothetical protein